MHILLINAEDEIDSNECFEARVRDIIHLFLIYEKGLKNIFAGLSHFTQVQVHMALYSWGIST